MEPELILIITVITVVAVASVFWQQSKAKKVLYNWARRNNYKLLSAKQRLFRRGPFFWSTSKSQMVYYITVQEKSGKIRDAWVRLGGFWWGMFQDRVEVRWKK